MNFGRYPSEVRRVAQELYYLLGDFNLTEKAKAFSESKNKMAEVSKVSAEDVEKAVKFLAKTQGQRAKAIEKMDEDAAIILIIRAYYVGIKGARLLEAVDSIYVTGNSYRNVARAAAEAALGLDQPPSLSELFYG